MDTFLQDLRQALRRLARSPGFTAVAVITLAIAIGANTAIWSIVSGVLLRPLPFPQPDRLVQARRATAQGASTQIAIPRFLFWRDHIQDFEHLALYDNLGAGLNLVGDGPPERIPGSRVSRDFLSVLGVHPLLGRDFLAEEDRPGARRVALLSHELWRRRFGADPRILGRVLRMNGNPYMVIGVLPPAFHFPARVEIWTPLQIDPGSRETGNYLEVVGRLRPGIGLLQASARLAAADRQFRAAFPDIVVTRSKQVIDLLPLRDRLYGEVRPALLVLMAAVFSVLLIACVNLANLQLVRAAARRREIALRNVLGAGALRLVRQLLTESLVLALGGGAAGALLAIAVLPILLALSPAQVDLLTPIRVDGGALAFTAGLALVSGLLFGLAPAIGAARSAPHSSIQETSTRAAGSRQGMRIRRLLVAAEVAMSLILLTAAGLLIRSFAGLLGTAPGFAPDHVLTAKLALPAQRYGDPAALDRFCRQVQARLAALPGVTHAAVVGTLPFEEGPRLTFTVDGRYRGKDSDEGNGLAEYRAVTSDYFSVLRIPLIAGRALTEADRSGAQGIVLINATTAHRFWPQGNALGARITIGPPAMPEMADPAPRTVVGIVQDVHENGLDQESPAILYVPVAQIAPRLSPMLISILPINAVMRTRGTQPGLAAALRSAVWAVDPEQPVTEVRWMDEIFSRSLGLRRFGAFLLAVLALIALLLAALGIYGVLSYLVEQRAREVGIRMALGASGAAILRMVLRQGMAAVLGGAVLGLAGSLALTRLLASQLVGIGVYDPVAFTLALAALVGITLVACGLPAHRASRMDPVVALQQD